jgi:putative transposase
VSLAWSPDLNAQAERWVKSAQKECLARLPLFGERALRQALKEYVVHYGAERPHQGMGSVVLFPGPSRGREDSSPIQRREQLGGLRKYSRCAAS